ncbi:dihydroneopterin triphosphate diphosphatase [Rhodoferax saidenbachensis]|uniref:dihydroneopterin triphosphate diphosphatase n=1 Tax=Rhodoferax saidenbachensis TaxID=1484693 RepID=UPI0004BC746C|nr:dihydroneopterin triphosphate diphosphatase [Rhodoferax saidenbachensis]
MSAPYKIPQSVLVVIHTPALEVLLLRRADTQEDFWQSVTGSKDLPDEPWAVTAAREVWEETGIDCRAGTALASQLQDWHLENVYAIYPRWAHRYAPGVTHNTERVFGLQVPVPTPVHLSPREHTAYQWLPWERAAGLCFSGSNAQAIARLEHFDAAALAESAQGASVLIARGGT